MTHPEPAWRLEDVDPEVRAIAESRASQSGISVGAWVESVVRAELDSGSGAPGSLPDFISSEFEASRHRLDQSLRQMGLALQDLALRVDAAESRREQDSGSLQWDGPSDPSTQDARPEPVPPTGDLEPYAAPDEEPVSRDDPPPPPPAPSPAPRAESRSRGGVIAFILLVIIAGGATVSYLYAEPLGLGEVRAHVEQAGRKHLASAKNTLDDAVAAAMQFVAGDEGAEVQVAAAPGTDTDTDKPAPAVRPAATEATSTETPSTVGAPARQPAGTADPDGTSASATATGPTATGPTPTGPTPTGPTAGKDRTPETDQAAGRNETAGTEETAVTGLPAGAPKDGGTESTPPGPGGDVLADSRAAVPAQAAPAADSPPSTASAVTAGSSDPAVASAPAAAAAPAPGTAEGGMPPSTESRTAPAASAQSAGQPPEPVIRQILVDERTPAEKARDLMDLARILLGANPDELAYAAAARVLRDAADAGSAEAQYNLGLFHERGLGVDRDDGAALAWYRKAAAQAHPYSQFNLAVFHLKGRGTPQDDALAAQAFETAAALGVSRASYILAVLTERGRGVPANRARARELYEQAAEGGVAEARERLEKGWSTE